MKKMKKLLCLIAVAVAFPMALRAETWKNAALMDGYGILTSDGSFLKFDAAGNKQVEAALKATKKTDHLRVDVQGELKGSEIAVKSVSLD